MNIHNGTAAVLLFAVAVLLLSACDRTSESPEDQIKAYVAAGETAARARDPLKIKSLIAENYLDHRGRNRQGLVALITGYFFRHKNIHTLTRIKKLTFPQSNRAELVLLAGIAGDPVGDFEHLLALRATIHLFELQLVREEDVWLLQSARWRRAKREELLSSE